MPKSEERSTSWSHSDGYPEDQRSSASVSTGKKEGSGDDLNSQDDGKSDHGNNALANGMSLRDRRKRPRANYRYSPELTAAPAPATEKRSTVKTEKSSATSMNTSSDLSHWLQCDVCHKWRIVDHRVFGELKTLSHFQCRNLQGVTCKDRDDWASGGASEDTSIKDDSSIGYKRNTKPNRQSNKFRRVNIFAGRYIPGFAGEFSDLGED